MTSTDQKDYYSILGVDRNASQQEVRAAYRKLAFQCHPDRNKEDPDAAKKMRHINEAYAILSDPARRSDYDRLKEQYGLNAYERYRQTHTTEDVFRGSDIDQIFEEFARQFGFRSSREIFNESYGPEYRSFGFRKPGMSGRGFVLYQTPRSRTGAP